MCSYGDGSIPSSRNAFSSSFLKRIGERDEPPTAGEAGVAGPWLVEEISGEGWGLFPPGAGHALGDRPYAVFHERWLALLAQVALERAGAILDGRV